jgi:hypothetical protein
MANSKLECIVELEFPSLLVEFKIFNLALPKSIKPKLLFSSIDLNVGSPMSTTEFSQLIEIFD